MGTGQILRDFSGWTSAHGIPHIGSAQNLCLRLFWTIIFLGSTGMFIFQMVLLVKKYLSYAVTVQTELKFEERYFPAVTVCNLNPYKYTELDNAPEMSLLVANYTKAIASDMTADPDNYWGFNNLSDTIAIQSRARDHLVLLAADYKKNQPGIINTTTYERDEFIQNCAYNTKPCVADQDFLKIIDPIYGACYTFNFKEDPPTYKSTRAGPLYGLRLLLKSNQTEYLPLTESAGVRVAVHAQGEEPFPDAFGYNAAAGFTTSFGIKFIRTERKAQPYGNCTKEKGTGKYFYGGTYSVEGCFRSCFQDNINTKCGCYDPRFAADSDDYCSTDKINCLQSFSSTNQEGGFNAIEECSCPQPCDESTYGVTVSTALWPSDVYNPPDCKEASPSWTNQEECATWYGENTMLIEVYYERMNYQLLSESEAYGLVNLVSDMGGQLGLWMGISVITVVEFISLLVLLCLYCMARQKAPPEQDDDDDDDDSDSDDDDKKEPDNDPPPPYEGQ